MKNLQISITDEQHKGLRIRAAEADTTVAEMMRELIDSFLLKVMK